MRNNTESAFITCKLDGQPFSAFVDGMPANHEHDSKGDLVYYTSSGKRLAWNTHKEYASFTTEFRAILLHAKYEALEDQITSCTTTCSKCGIEAIMDAYWM